MKSSSVSEETKDVKKINNRIIGEVKSKPSKLYWSGVDTKDNWIKAFKEKFGWIDQSLHEWYLECGMDDDIESATEQLESFISQVEKDAEQRGYDKAKRELQPINGGQG